MDQAEADPKGLIRESFRIEGITVGECRSIFMDWALSVPENHAIPEAVRVLIAAYAPMAPDHPMTGVLREAEAAPEAPRRRGGRAGRHGPGARD
jgi:hypothetical protein